MPYHATPYSHYMKQLLEGVKHLHKQGIVHRDIRTCHVCLASQENSSPVKLAGFSSAISVQELEERNEYGGCLLECHVHKFQSY